MEIKNYLSKVKKECTWLNWSVYSELNSGADFRIIILDEKYVLRIAREKLYEPILASEFRFMKFICSRIDISIPDYIYYSSKNKFGLYTYLKGEVLTQRLINGNLEIISKQLGVFLKSLHSLNYPELEPSNYVQNSIDQLVLDWDTQIRSLLDFKVEQLIRRSLLNYKKERDLGAIKSCLIHGDLSCNNILWDQETKSIKVLDFSDRDKFDPYYDLSELFEFGEAFMKMVFMSYSGNLKGYTVSRFYYQIRPLLKINESINQKRLNDSSELINLELKKLNQRMSLE